MTQTAERLKQVPLTDPVPGEWMQTTYGQVVYVPLEKVEHRDNFGNVHVSMEQGAHIKRIISEGGKFVRPPEMAVQVAPVQTAPEMAQFAQMQTDIQAEMEALRKERAELMALREQLEQERAANIGAAREAGKSMKSGSR